jgi:uncharacterized phage protein (TIGR02216 family)
MAMGLGVLALPPHVFWALTPKELDAALRGRFGKGSALSALPRGEFDALMQQFPD